MYNKINEYLREYKPLLTNRRLMTIITAGVISSFGSKISYFALLRKVYAISGGRITDLGFLTMAEMIPAVVLGTLAGYMIDRVSRKWTMVISDIMSGIVILTVIFADNINLIYIIAFASASVYVFREPAQRAFEPNLVVKEDIPLLNSFMSATNSLVQIVGSATGAAIVGFVGVTNAFVIDSATFFASAAIILTVSIKENHTLKQEKAEINSNPVKEFLSGVSIMWTDKAIKLMVLIEVYLTFAMAMQGILIYVFIKETLKMGAMAELAWGILLSSLGVGAVLGSVVIGVKVKQYRNKFKLFLNILMFDAVFFTLFLINKFFPISVLLFAFLGVVGSAYMIILNSVLQAAVPDENRGKVFSVLAMLRGPVGVLSVLVGTTAATFITAQAVLLAAAGIEALIAVGVRLTKAYKEVDDIMAVKELAEKPENKADKVFSE
ncbi:MAG TPA: MFS transporter [Candidatus Nitrosocosmicus sp.]|nr:MFS transporter [Candidatus Nitrosocosmicus sp.]